MVVIATRNGEIYVRDLLSDITRYNIPNNDVCIVDNSSTDLHHIEYLKDLEKEGYKILFNPNGGYELGAYKLAIDTFKSDVWFCFQDTIRIDQNIFEMITPKLTDKNVYTFLTFDWPDHVFVYTIYKFLFTNYGSIRYKTGIMGNMFFAKDTVIQLVKNEWAMPTCKLEDMATEIGLGILFEKHGIEIVGLDVSDERHDAYKGSRGYPFFRKIAGGRQ